MLRPLLLLLPCLLALAWDMDDLHARGHLDRDIPGFDQEFEVGGVVRGNRGKSSLTGHGG